MRAIALWFKDTPVGSPRQCTDFVGQWREEMPVVRFCRLGIGLDVIQTPKPEPRIMRYELMDFEWAAIRPFLPNKPRGIPDSNI
jgi:hypothetical protein